MIRSVKLLISDADNEVLVLRRSKTHPRHPLGPDLPGGVVDENEELKNGAVRELLEETGINVDANDLEELYSVKDTVGDNLPIHRVIYGLKINDSKPDIVLSWEHDKYEWIELSSLKGLERSNQLGVDTILSSM